MGAAGPGVFLTVGWVILGFAFRRGAHRPAGVSFPPIPSVWKWLFRSIFAAFFVVYFFNAMAPKMSTDGATFHLGFVARYLRPHGSDRITTNKSANLSQGVEMR